MASSAHPEVYNGCMSSAVMRGESRFTRSTNRNSALCFSSSPDVSRSRSTPHTSSSSPSNSAATAACDFSQNGHALRADVYAAISSRIPAGNAPGPRMISGVNRARCVVALGRYANMCQICGYSSPLACIMRIWSAYGPGFGFCSTSGRNIGFILGFPASPCIGVSISVGAGFAQYPKTTIPRVRTCRRPPHFSVVAPQPATKTSYGQYILTTGEGITGQVEMDWGRFFYDSRFRGKRPIADVGPGRCWFTRQNTADIVAIDNAPDVVAHYRGSLRIAVGSAQAIPFPDAHFEGVFCCWLFE